jgi:hypothetical protein
MTAPASVTRSVHGPCDVQPGSSEAQNLRTGRFPGGGLLVGLGEGLGFVVVVAVGLGVGTGVFVVGLGGAVYEGFAAGGGGVSAGGGAGLSAA